MLKKFYPQMYVRHIWEINPGKLWARGLRGVIVDLDNTIIPWRSTQFPDKVIKWLKSMQDTGFKICVVSNAKSRRVRDLIGPLDIPAIPKAIKPLRKAFKRAMEIMGTGWEETAVIGDQMFTDILGGNRLSLYTVLVFPMSRREFIGTKLIRQFEKVILHRYKRKYM